VMGVLERRNQYAARYEPRDQLGDQRGFALTAPTCETDNTHGPL
jgi:hypothetical protein